MAMAIQPVLTVREGEFPSRIEGTLANYGEFAKGKLFSWDEYRFFNRADPSLTSIIHVRNKKTYGGVIVVSYEEETNEKILKDLGELFKTDFWTIEESKHEMAKAILGILPENIFDVYKQAFLRLVTS